MDVLHKVKVVDLVSSKRRGEVSGEFFELLQIRAKLHVGDVVDDVQERNCCTGIVGRLGGSVTLWPSSGADSD